MPSQRWEKGQTGNPGKKGRQSGRPQASLSLRLMRRAWRYPEAPAPGKAGSRAKGKNPESAMGEDSRRELASYRALYAANIQNFYRIMEEKESALRAEQRAWDLSHAPEVATEPTLDEGTAKVLELIKELGGVG